MPEPESLSAILGRLREKLARGELPVMPDNVAQLPPSPGGSLTRANVPARYRGDVANGLTATPATSAVRAFMADPRRSLLALCGPAGTGKSCAACEGLARVPGRYVLAAELAGAFRRLDFRAFTESLGDAELLVVDELGREPDAASGGERSALWEVIERRWAAARKTILATNLTPDAFVKRYGDHILDRIREDRGLVVLAGKSLRGAA